MHHGIRGLFFLIDAVLEGEHVNIVTLYIP